jgi:hypothetical protein
LQKLDASNDRCGRRSRSRRGGDAAHRHRGEPATPELAPLEDVAALVPMTVHTAIESNCHGAIARFCFWRHFTYMRDILFGLGRDPSGSGTASTGARTGPSGERESTQHG